MKLTDSERNAVVKLQLDKAYNTFQQIALLKEAGYGIILPIDYIMPCSMPFVDY